MLKRKCTLYKMARNKSDFDRWKLCDAREREREWEGRKKNVILVFDKFDRHLWNLDRNTTTTRSYYCRQFHVTIYIDSLTGSTRFIIYSVFFLYENWLRTFLSFFFWITLNVFFFFFFHSAKPKENRTT